MPGYKTILVPISDAESGACALDSALSLAARFGGHVAALHVRPDPTQAVPLVGEGMSGAMVEEMINLAEAEGGRRAALARAAFDAACARLGAVRATSAPAEGATAEWIELVGREEDQVAWRGRLSDLIALARPGGDEELPSKLTLDAALFGSGRPLLLCPPESPSPGFGRSVAIAWNGSAEASRAVGWAMPLLREAGRVTILSVSDHGTDPVEAPAGALAGYLAWHGVAAEIHLTQASNSHAGEELLRQAGACGADLLVMGAYTHSRLRQLILGGVTRHVVAHAPLHCLLCH
jgi:nucleotide-binding universal stress UspA family protein